MLPEKTERRFILFEIGKETARRMWGCGSPMETSDCNSNQKHRPSRQARPRYQVLVTVHLNTDNIHCHFVVNPVSFKDGAKFKNKIGDHKELRKISDEICREHELSVLENSDFYSKGKKKEYWVHKVGKKTHRDYLREDVEYCLSFATNPREFENQLYALGYMLDPVRFSVKAKHWERAVRLSSIGFSKERVNEQLRQNAENRYRLFTLEYRPPYKPKKFPLEDELRKLDFSIEHSYDTATVLVDAVFYTGCAVNFKSTTVSFKVHKKIYNPIEEQQIIPNMQEPIISEELFDRVQELRSHKRRNTKTGRASLFAGLLFCPDCGAKLHFCAAKSLKPNQEFYRCANYNSGRGTCDIHYIRNVVLEQIVAEAIGSLADFVRCYEPIFLYLLAKNNTAARQSEVQKLKQTITASERRIQAIDKAIEGLFEANLTGKITDERFTKMTANYEKEQKELLEIVADGKKKLLEAEQTKVDLRLLMKALREYTDIRQLTPEIVNALIRRIEVHSKDKETKKVKVDIYFTAVGLFSIPTEKEMQAAMEEIRQNPQQFKFSA